MVVVHLGDGIPMLLASIVALVSVAPEDTNDAVRLGVIVSKLFGAATTEATFFVGGFFALKHVELIHWKSSNVTLGGRI